MPIWDYWENQREFWSQPYVTLANSFNLHLNSIKKPLNFRKRISISRDKRAYGLRSLSNFVALVDIPALNFFNMGNWDSGVIKPENIPLHGPTIKHK